MDIKDDFELLTGLGIKLKKGFHLSVRTKSLRIAVNYEYPENVRECNLKYFVDFEYSYLHLGKYRYYGEQSVELTKDLYYKTLIGYGG